MAYALIVNPSSHAKKKKRKHKVRRAMRRNPANPVKRRRRSSARKHSARRFRRNPSALAGFRLNQVTGQIMPVALGAGGAMLVDFAIDKLPLPINFKFGNLRHVTKAGVAVGMGILAGMVVGKDKGTKVMAGALTVVAYDALKGMLAKMAAPAAVALPPATVQGMGYYPELEYENGDSMGMLLENGVGEYDGDYDQEMDGMGEILEY